MGIIVTATDDCCKCLQRVVLKIVESRLAFFTSGGTASGLGRGRHAGAWRSWLVGLKDTSKGCRAFPVLKCGGFTVLYSIHPRSVALARIGYLTIVSTH